MNEDPGSTPRFNFARPDHSDPAKTRPIGPTPAPSLPPREDGASASEPVSDHEPFPVTDSVSTPSIPEERVAASVSSSTAVSQASTPILPASSPPQRKEDTELPHQQDSPSVPPSRSLTEEDFRALMRPASSPLSAPPDRSKAIPPMPTSRAWLRWLGWILALTSLAAAVYFTRHWWLPLITPKPNAPLISPPVARQNPVPETSIQAVDSTHHPISEWLFYVQIYASRDQYSATKVSNTYRAAGFSVRVESEFVARLRRPVYKVRLGPYEQRTIAVGIRDTARGRGYSDAFLDSLRREEGDTATVAGTAPLPALPAPAPRVAPPVPRTRGFAIKVSATKDDEGARTLRARLVKLGFPSYQRTEGSGPSRWNRVYVGPFSTRAEADAYRKLVEAGIGPGSIIVDLGRE